MWAYVLPLLAFSFTAIHKMSSAVVGELWLLAGVASTMRALGLLIGCLPMALSYCALSGVCAGPVWVVVIVAAAGCSHLPTRSTGFCPPFFLAIPGPPCATLESHEMQGVWPGKTKQGPRPLAFFWTVLRLASSLVNTVYTHRLMVAYSLPRYAAPPRAELRRYHK